MSADDAEMVPDSPLPTVSVVIRNYNRAETVGRAIDSALAQTWQDFEIVVVDDASTDRSVETITRRYGTCEKLRLVELLTNRGAAAAANTGVDLARGRYVAFLDSDDEWLPDFLRYHVEALEEHPRAVMTYCAMFQVWAHFGLERLVRPRHSNNQRVDMLFGGFVHSQSMTVARREALIDCGGFDEAFKVSHDFDLWLRFALEHERPFVFIDRPLLRYHMSADALTTDYRTWSDEYRAVLDAGYAHAAARPYRKHKDKAKERVRGMVMVRREIERWLRATSEKTVSVIVRTHNRLDSLRRAIESIDAQDYRNFEIIVINDGSTDATAAWLNAQQREDFKPVNFDHSRGRAAALNYGALIADGELLTFLDDDDEWLPGYLSAQVRAHSFVANTPVFSYTDYYLRTSDRPTPARRSHPQPAGISDLFAHHLFNTCPHSLSMFAVMRDAFRAIDGADETLPIGEDTDLYLRLLAASCNPLGERPAEHAPAHVRLPLVVWRREDDGQRAAMKALYLESAERIHEGFFATGVGRHYRHLRGELASHFRDTMSRAYRYHFGL